jgi:hypothetical protein
MQLVLLVMLEIRELDEHDPQLEAVLIDTVESGGSIGFMPPVSPDEARSVLG